MIVNPFTVGIESELDVARMSEIGSPKQDESDELVFSCSSPVVLIGFSESHRPVSEPDVTASLEESVLNAIPYSFGWSAFGGLWIESLGFGIKGVTFGLQPSDSTPESGCRKRV